MSKRPKYYFCCWCSRQLWCKRFYVTMRSTASANENGGEVLVHRACADDMEREGTWELAIEAA